MTVCSGCGERIHKDPEGIWSITAWVSKQPIYECRPEGYNYEYGTLFHGPEGE